MKMLEIAEKLNLQAASVPAEDKEVEGVYIGDLMSLAMSNLEEGQIWITIQTNLNTVAVAALKEAAGVILAEGVSPDDNAKEKAEDEGIGVYTSPLSAYELAKQLGALGI